MPKRSLFHDQLLSCGLYTEIRLEEPWLVNDLRDSLLGLGEEIPTTQIVSRALRTFRRSELLNANPIANQSGLGYEYRLTDGGLYEAVCATGREIARGEFYAMTVINALGSSSLLERIEK